MINDDGLVELAKYCAETCYVLRNVAQGRDPDGLSGPSKKGIEDLGRYVHLAHFSLATITSEIRIMSNIASMVSERRNYAHDLGEHHPGSTEERLIAWRTELRGIQRILDVRDFLRLSVRGAHDFWATKDTGLGDAHAASEPKQRVQRSADSETSASVFMMVRCFFVPHSTPR